MFCANRLSPKCSASLIALAIGIGSSPGVALAQDQDQDSTSDRGVLEEIVVTAQKRAENVQSIPIAITALDASSLERSQIDSLVDVMNFVPNLQFGNFSSTATVAIRGIGYTNTTAGGDPGVALHIDGVYLGRPIATVFNFFDLQRLEILRGPQGTLYGRNTTGGSINYITEKPSNEMEGMAELLYGRYQHFQAQGMLNMPLGERAAARFVVGVSESDGYQKNLVKGGTESGDQDWVNLRGQVRFDLADNIELLTSVNYADVGGVGSTSETRFPFKTGPNDFVGVPPPFVNTILSDAFLNRPDLAPLLRAKGINDADDVRAFFGLDVGTPDPADGALFSLAPAFASAGVTNDLRPNVVAKDTAETNDQEMLVVSGTLTWELDGMVFKSITAYAETSFDAVSDLDHSSAPIMELHLIEDQDQFSQELQLASASSGPLEWLVGAYYFNEDATRISFIKADDFDRLGALLGREYGFEVGGDVEATSYALFAQASYDLTDQLRLTGGFRWSWDEKDALITLLSPFPAFNFATFVNDAPVGEKWNEPSGKVSLDYQVNDDAMIYASYSHGYKSGGINLNGTPNTAVYDPEFVDVIEIGAKTRYNDRVQFNVAGFWNDYTDIQVQTFGPTGAELRNAAAATIWGLEAEMVAVLSETAELNMSVGFLDAEFDDFIFNPPGAPLPPAGFPPPNTGGARPPAGPSTPIDLSGNRLSRAPKVTFSAGLQNRFPLAGNMGSVTARGDFYYKAKQFFDPDNDADATAASYINLDFRLRWDNADDSVYAEAFVTNLTDKTQIRDILISIPFLQGGVDLTTYQPPRSWGFRLGYRF